MQDPTSWDEDGHEKGGVCWLQLEPQSPRGLLVQEDTCAACLKFSSKHSTCCVWMKRSAEYNPKNTSPQFSMEVETLWFGAVFLLRIQNDFTSLKDRAISFPMHNIRTICHALRRLIVKQKVPSHVLIKGSGFSIDSYIWSDKRCLEQRLQPSIPTQTHESNHW